MPSSALRTRSASCPRTTINGSKPAFAARPTARRTSGSPSSSMKSLFCPIRVDVPAASTTPAMLPARSGMNRLSPFTQVPRRLTRDHGEQLAHDADRDLLGAVGAETESDRREHPVVMRGADLAEHLIGARPRPEQADIGHGRVQETPDPVAIDVERMRLDHHERARVDV